MLQATLSGSADWGPRSSAEGLSEPHLPRVPLDPAKLLVTEFGLGGLLLSASSDGTEYLLQAALQGDKSAYGRLCQRFEHRWKGLARHMTGDRSASDIVQDAYLAGWSSLAQLKGTGVAQWYRWFERIVWRKAIDHRRRARQLPVVEGGISFGATIAAAVPEPGKAVSDRDEYEKLVIALGRLSAEDQRVLELRFFESAEYTAIASDIGCSEVAARQKVHRALTRWRNEATDRSL